MASSRCGWRSSTTTTPRSSSYWLVAIHRRSFLLWAVSVLSASSRNFPPKTASATTTRSDGCCSTVETLPSSHRVVRHPRRSGSSCCGGALRGRPVSARALLPHVLEQGARASNRFLHRLQSLSSSPRTRLDTLRLLSGLSRRQSDSWEAVRARMEAISTQAAIGEMHEKDTEGSTAFATAVVGTWLRSGRAAREHGRAGQAGHQ